MKKLISVLMVLGFVWMITATNLIGQEQKKEFDYDRWEKIPGNVRVTFGLTILSENGEFVHASLAFYNGIVEDDKLPEYGIAKISLKELLAPVHTLYKDNNYYTHDPASLCFVVIDTTRLKANVDLFSPVTINVYSSDDSKKILFSNFSYPYSGEECLLIPANKLEKGLYMVEIEWYAWPRFDPKKTRYKIRRKKSYLIDLYITD